MENTSKALYDYLKNLITAVLLMKFFFMYNKRTTIILIKLIKFLNIFYLY